MKQTPRIEFNWGFHDGVGAAISKRSYHSIDSNKVAGKHYKAGWRAGFDYFRANGTAADDRDSGAAWKQYREPMKKNPASNARPAHWVIKNVIGAQSNPAKVIRSRARPMLRDRHNYQALRLRGRARSDMTGGTLGDANFHVVQVRRGTRWVFLAGFSRGEIGKARAVDYGRMLARRYPRNTFRVFWPDVDKASHVKKNPAPRSPDAEPGASGKVRQAAALYQAFTGHKATTGKQVRLPAASVGLAIGPLLAVAYETTRDGKREKYMHEFRRGARPLLASSHDGLSLYLLGGAYRFTDRGIVDRS